MRIWPIALASAIALATFPSSGQGRRPAKYNDARSVAFAELAESLAAAGRFSEATDAFATALAIDPRNHTAYTGLARIAQGQQLPGKAVGLYAKALRLEPNDVNALAGQGEAFVERGAVNLAKQNLEKIKRLCRAVCPQASSLAAAITKGPPVVTAEVTPESASPR